MYQVVRIKKFDILRLFKVSCILYACGKDMAEKYNLQHWNNPHIKNWVIVILCALKNDIYLVYDEQKPVATFQTKQIGDALSFCKLATSPDFSGKGIGTFCLNEIEKTAKEKGCNEIVCEVYDKSEHAKAFYMRRGYFVYDETQTLKFKELKLKKEL